MKEEDFCKKICSHCKYRCVLKKHNGKVEFYGCFGRQNGYRDFVYDFIRSKLLTKLYALSGDTGEFVSPFEEFGIINDKVEEKRIFLDDDEFYRLIKEQYPKCEYKPEMELAEWSLDKNEGD